MPKMAILDRIIEKAEDVQSGKLTIDELIIWLESATQKTRSRLSHDIESEIRNALLENDANRESVCEQIDFGTPLDELADSLYIQLRDHKLDNGRYPSRSAIRRALVNFRRYAREYERAKK